MLVVSNGQRGSVTILALSTVIFLGVMIAALLPMMMQEVKTSAMDRDQLEARYAAEAGIKRAIIDLGQGNNVSGWEKQFQKFGPSSVIRKEYFVSIVDQDGKTPFLGIALPQHRYTITSDGFVGSNRQTVQSNYP